MKTHALSLGLFLLLSLALTGIAVANSTESVRAIGSTPLHSGEEGGALFSLADEEILRELNRGLRAEENAGDSGVIDLDVGFSNMLVFGFPAIGLMFIAGTAFFLSGRFRRGSLRLKLYAGFGGLIVIIVTASVLGFGYMVQVTTAGALEARMLKVVQALDRVELAENQFLLHGIEDREYGDKQLAKANALIETVTREIESLEADNHLDAVELKAVQQVHEDVERFKELLKDISVQFHEVEEDKESMSRSYLSASETLETMVRHHTELLDELSRQPDSPGARREIARQNRILLELEGADIEILKISRGGVEFMLDKRAERIGELQALAEAFMNRVKRLEQELSDTNERQRLVTLERDFQGYLTLLKEVVRNEGLLTREQREVNSLSSDIQHQSEQVVSRLEAFAHELEREGEIALAVLAVLGALLGTLMAAFLTPAIARPINTAISGLNATSEGVAVAASQVSAASQQLAEGASEQAASMEETSSTVFEFSSQVQSNADIAKKAEGDSERARTILSNGRTAMSRLTSSIEEIDAATGRMAAIIKNIDEIAFQTNLLALNASVEAARAGDSGRGFTVVADEVRELAQRAAASARDTTALIEESQQRTKSGVSATQEMNGIFDEINQIIDSMDSLVVDVSRSCHAQAEGIQQITTGVQMLDTVTQGNAANAEETASASEELTQQAASLKQTIEELQGLVTGQAGRAVSNGGPAFGGNGKFPSPETPSRQAAPGAGPWHGEDTEAPASLPPGVLDESAWAEMQPAGNRMPDTEAT